MYIEEMWGNNSTVTTMQTILLVELYLIAPILDQMPPNNQLISTV